MSIHPKFRGAAAVGHLMELPPEDANLIISFRLWSSGIEGQQMLWNILAGQLGSTRANSTMRNFESLMRLCESHGRRKLMRHGLSCNCAGSDECCLANFVSVAATGDREDALMIAMTILRADMAPCALALAQQVGLVMKTIAPLATERNNDAPDGSPNPTSIPKQTLH